MQKKLGVNVAEVDQQSLSAWPAIAGLFIHTLH